jgi:hypothetical protein
VEWKKYAFEFKGLSGFNGNGLMMLVISGGLEKGPFTLLENMKFIEETWTGICGFIFHPGIFYAAANLPIFHRYVYGENESIFIYFENQDHILIKK